MNACGQRRNMKDSSGIQYQKWSLGINGCQDATEQKPTMASKLDPNSKPFSPRTINGGGSTNSMSSKRKLKFRNCFASWLELKYLEIFSRSWREWEQSRRRRWQRRQAQANLVQERIERNEQTTSVEINRPQSKSQPQKCEQQCRKIAYEYEYERQWNGQWRLRTAISGPKH